MYLRLQHAGVFFESLTTPERITVIQTMGGLTAQQARLLEDTSVFFRALDHAIRVATGHSSSKIPTSVSQQQNLGNLLGRWSKIKTAAQPLASLVQEVRQRTRAVFLEIFGVR
jgi:hypothetical protein